MVVYYCFCYRILIATEYQVIVVLGSYLFSEKEVHVVQENATKSKNYAMIIFPPHHSPHAKHTKEKHKIHQKMSFFQQKKKHKTHQKFN